MSTAYSSSSLSRADPELIRRRVIPELDKGRRYAEQLLGQLQFRRPSPAASSAANLDAKIELVQEVMRCFTSSIAVLMEPLGGMSALQTPSDNQDSTKIALVNNKRKKPQGNERRRKTRVGETREMIKSDGYAIHDNYSWRKYGEKKINGYNFPREYFRCSHQGCQATKRVQKIQDGDPGLCLVTCTNEHSCISIDAVQDTYNDQNSCYRMDVKEERDVQVEPSTSCPFEDQPLAHVTSALGGMQTYSPLGSHDDILASMLLQAEDALAMHVSDCPSDQTDRFGYGFQQSPVGPLDFKDIDDCYPELEEATGAYLVPIELENIDGLWF